jgi:hypothetical protein
MAKNLILTKKSDFKLIDVVNHMWLSTRDPQWVPNVINLEVLHYSFSFAKIDKQTKKNLNP